LVETAATRGKESSLSGVHGDGKKKNICRQRVVGEKIGP
jgi:hypothetical protein